VAVKKTQVVKKGKDLTVQQLTDRIAELTKRGQGASKMCEHLKKVLATTKK